MSNGIYYIQQELNLFDRPVDVNPTKGVRIKIKHCYKEWHHILYKEKGFFKMWNYILEAELNNNPSYGRKWFHSDYVIEKAKEYKNNPHLINEYNETQRNKFEEMKNRYCVLNKEI